MGEQFIKKPTNKNPDPVISLTRQFNKLMLGKSTPGIKDRPVGGWVKIEKESNPNPQNRKYELIHIDSEGRKIHRYNRENRIYQMQVDFCYLIREVKFTEGKKAAAIRQCQEFINSCKEEFALAKAV